METNTQNFKQFIRHGRNAYPTGNKANSRPMSMENISVQSLDPSESPASTSPDPAAIQQLGASKRRHRKDEYSKLAADLVNEENEQRKKEEERQALERYQMIDKIGEGAFSTVYKALDVQTNEAVAVKVIKKYQLDKSQQASVLKEVRIMRQLDHPCIVKFYNFIETEEFYFIVQELVSGGEIFNEIVKYTYFSEDLSRHVITQVAQAIKYLHAEKGVVHRDLKPENIFFNPIKHIPSKSPRFRKSDDPNSKLDEGEFIPNVGGGGIGTIKIGDFGLSKQIYADASLKTPCGTIGYTAPEIVKDMRYSEQVDMWALGCVLYILLCGFPPFFNDQIDVLTKKVAKGEFEFLSPWWDEISDGAKNCVSKLLTVDPRERYTIEDFLNDPWILDFLTRCHQAQHFQEHQQQLLHQKNSISSSDLSYNFQSASVGSDSSQEPMVYAPLPMAANSGAIPSQLSKQNPTLYSPAAIAMREAFDISTAVHRMGEAAAMKKYLRQHKNGTSKLGALAEDDEMGEPDPNEIHPEVKKANLKFEKESSRGAVIDDNSIFASNNELSSSGDGFSDVDTSSKPFELNLNTATILSRRKKKALMAYT
ncbi:hypothetical protein KL930_001421 [Ogataea haglerorum]|nr:hypothetical protein KL951_001907 [Ogataea haglerorum]KAG7780496.1 hypothetical protein KL922_000847 [Ogataea haglerorum]KAG7781925.1 hypothetical protein KL930_001421 [Ogataea haglerorum]KAG7797233.1 hypothetical protein KL929_002939 [Ogataea haglerorum]KAG7801672.1 hypothetical protein KL944_003404 [Ogataea haglerorum]